MTQTKKQKECLRITTSSTQAMAQRGQHAASRTSVMLNSGMKNFDAQTVEAELIKILNDKSKKFKIGGMSFEYDH